MKNAMTLRPTDLELNLTQLVEKITHCSVEPSEQIALATQLTDHLWNEYQLRNAFVEQCMHAHYLEAPKVLF